MNMSEQFPVYAPDLIKTIVTVAHFDLNQLRKRIDSHPQLVKSAWDWGFGDWESPLGAACHMGRHDIAEFLLEKGASPSLFSWVLFGDLSMVRRIVEQQPGIQRVAGPHSITLLAHARMGGKKSEAVLEYLASLNDSDGLRPVELSRQDAAAICGTYRIGDGPSQSVHVSDDVSGYQNSPMYTYAPQLNWTREGMMGRPLFHAGDWVFNPAGAPAIQIRFTSANGSVVMTIEDGESILTGFRRLNA